MKHPLALFCLVATLLACAHAAPLLTDLPMAGDAGEPIYLDDASGASWRLDGPAGSGVSGVRATVPGDLITDLQTARIIDDPLFGLNFLATTWDAGNFTYSRQFAVPAATVAAASSLLLVFDSLKMAAIVELNGAVVGTVTDQFVRPSFDVRSLLNTKAGGVNTLAVTFLPSSHALNDRARFMSCSGAWDWAPYGTTFTNTGAHTMSKGIVRSVYLLPVAAFAITHVVPQIFYSGAYAAAPLTEATTGDFAVSVRVHISAPASVGVGSQSSMLAVTAIGSWPNATAATQTVALRAGESMVTVALPPVDGASVRLWWPAGMGEQALYSIGVSATVVAANSNDKAAGNANGNTNGNGNAAVSPTVEATRRVGFRVVYLVTTDDANPAAPTAEGSGDFTMRLRVNGANMHARGANIIPMEEFEGRQTAAAYRSMLQSAVDARMNAVRVWGGGVFLPELFYDVCDELGLVIALHDVMYGTPWMGGNESVPTGSRDESAELAHAVRRLSAHPSIFAWNGGNEWYGKLPATLFEQFVLPSIVAEDMSRPVWPASPSAGLATGVYTLTGLPNGRPFRIVDQDSKIEVHGPYRHGTGFATVNSLGPFEPFDANQPPLLDPRGTLLGVRAPGVFASEFGVSVFSSYESMAPTLSTAGQIAHSAEMFQRNYCADSIIEVYFGVAPYNQTKSSPQNFQALTYLSMLGSALELAADISQRRSRNEFALFVWQLGEVWPTGGWGSLEYGPAPGFTAGQVLGGRWKPIHHMYAQHLYRDTVLVCGKDGACLLRHDGALAGVAGKAALSIVHVGTGQSQALSSWSFELPIGPGASQWYCAASAQATDYTAPACQSWADAVAPLGCAADLSDCVLSVSVYDASGNVLDAHTVLLTAPARMRLPAAAVTATIGAVRADGTAPVTLSALGGAALYATLTSTAQGRFSDNSVLVTPARPVELSFVPFIAGEAATAQNTRVEHVALYTTGMGVDARSDGGAAVLGSARVVDA